MDARFLCFVDLFNRQQFYLAHEVLEELWLPSRGGPDNAFYKGLIQLAGAFVHLQKQRSGPAAALFKLSQTNLGLYPEKYGGLDLGLVIEQIKLWLRELEGKQFTSNLMEQHQPPVLRLI